MICEPVIESFGLSKSYGGFDAVKDLTFQVLGPRITGFLGRNGAGKSSTIKMLLGMIQPSSGMATVLGHRIDAPEQSLEIRRKVAYVGEDKGLYGYMTVAQLIWFTRSFYPDWRPEIEKRLITEYQLPLGRKVKALSKGMRTKLALLLALSRRPSLLILDEPTEGLDPVSIEDLLRTITSIAAEGTSVFFSSHQLNEVERIADAVLMIDRGTLVLNFAMDELRENYRRVTVGFDRAAPNIDIQLPGIERVRTDGRQLSVLASRNSDAIVEWAKRSSATSIDTQPVSLREIFLETVQVERVAAGNP